jgi:hypothetical protein
MRFIIGRSEYISGKYGRAWRLIWNRYHDENTKEEDLTHPEDIAHFKLHDQLEDEAEAQAQLDKQPIVDHNIPAKFRKDL